MNNIILKSFISKLDYISKMIGYSNSDTYEINFENTNNNEIIGNVYIKSENDKIIKFEIQISKSEDVLIFKSKYEISNIQKTEIDTFVIINQEIKSYFTPKTKYLIHLVDNQIKQAYIVNKKYKFSNGINENYSKLNMDNKEIYNNLKNNYEMQSIKKTR